MPSEVSHLRLPLAKPRGAELASRLEPYQLPADLEQLYRWHDGYDDWRDDSGYLPLFMDCSFPPLEAAIEVREWLVKFAKEEGDASGWPDCWFPAFGDSKTGEFVTLEPRSSPWSQVLWGYHSHDPELSPTFDSVTDLILTTAHLWENDLLPWTHDDDPEKHRRRLRLVAEMNPHCFDGRTDWTHRGYQTSCFLDDAWLDEWRRAIGYEPTEDPLPEPTPIGRLDLNEVSEPVPIAGKIRGLAGGVDWLNAEVTDETGSVKVHLSREATKNYITNNLGDRHMLWIVSLPPRPGNDEDRTDEVAAMGGRIFARVVAEAVATEIRPIYDSPPPAGPDS
jgi:hypothetical protein